MKLFVLLLLSAGLVLSSCASGETVKSFAATEITWTKEAQERFDNEVPDFVKKQAKKGVEKKAAEKGKKVVDVELYLEIKEEMGY